MVHHKRKKNTRQRGTHTHGWGSKKKHRGSGDRGGKGNAGSGKKADQKKPSYWAIKNYYGKHGFHSHARNPEFRTINLDDLQLRLESFTALGSIQKHGDTYEVLLNDLGYNKLLGSGHVQTKLKITVDYASENAVAKVQEKGGEVIVLKKKTETTEKRDKQ